jgi:hypothetical protein
MSWPRLQTVVPFTSPGSERPRANLSHAPAYRVTQGTGNPNRSLEDRTVDELRNRAKELDISGRSKMNKQELVRAIRKAR